jgi:hypothetical protein
MNSLCDLFVTEKPFELTEILRQLSVGSKLEL